MSWKDWQRYFRPGDELLTVVRPSPLRVEEVAAGYLRVSALGRQGHPTIDLTYDRLDALLEATRAGDLPSPRLNQGANAVWKRYGCQPDQQNEAQYWALVCERIRLADFEAEPEAEQLFTEGRRLEVTLSRAERNPRLREACIQTFGARCTVCGFDFGAVYGEIGEGFIHVHHLNPLAAVTGERACRFRKFWR